MWKLSKKASDTVLFGRENDDVHVPVHLAHMSKIVYLDDPALHVSLELHGILSWIWCCQVSAGVVQTERTVSDLGSPSAPLRPMTSPVVSPVVSAASSGGKVCLIRSTFSMTDRWWIPKPCVLSMSVYSTKWPHPWPDLDIVAGVSRVEVLTVTGPQVARDIWS